MRKRKIVAIIFLTVIIIILETLPTGVKMRFAPAPGEFFFTTCAYFDTVCFGYGDFGPLITATSSCGILVLAILNIFFDKKLLHNTMKIFITIAFCFSFSWLYVGFDTVTVIGVIINIVLFCEMMLVYYEKITQWRIRL